MNGFYDEECRRINDYFDHFPEVFEPMAQILKNMMVPGFRPKTISSLTPTPSLRTTATAYAISNSDGVGVKESLTLRVGRSPILDYSTFRLNGATPSGRITSNQNHFGLQI